MKDKFINILKSVGVFLFFFFFPPFFFMLFNVNTETIPDNIYLIYYTASNVVGLTILCLIYHKTLISDAKSFFKEFGKNMETAFKYWFLGFIVMLISNFIITFILKLQIAGNEEQVRNFIDISPLLMIFNTVIYAPISEELVFRKNIKDCVPSKWLYALTSGFLFSYLHIIGYIDSPISFIHIIPYASLGITFALLYHKTDNIYSSIMMHGLHNLIATMIYIIGAML